MKVNKKSHSQAYRQFEKQCENWETIKEGRRVYVSMKHRGESQKAPKLSNTLESIKAEKDIEKLKQVCSILAWKHPLIFTECIDSAKKLRINSKILNKINMLQAELDKLKEELK